MTFAREAWPFVLPFLAAAAGLAYWQQPGWALACLALAVAVLLFFRIPRRAAEAPAADVLAAADGRVLKVDVVEDPAIGPGRFHRVVTFLSVFDVHVQRAPVTGRVVHSAPRSGRKVAAFRGDADEVNASHLSVIQRPRGDRIGVRQIVGLVARRIVCDLEEGREIDRGERMGLIKFGSRVDLMVPESYRVMAAVGDTLRTGVTPVARPPEET